MTVDSVFDKCVEWLVLWADVTGLTYKEINVWIFCVIWPVITLLLVWAVLHQHARAEHYKFCNWMACTRVRELLDEQAKNK